MCLSCYSRLCRQADSYSLPVLTCAYAGLSGTLLVPPVDVHEVRKSGAPAASPAYRRAGGFLPLQAAAQIEHPFLSSKLGHKESVLCTPHTQKKVLGTIAAGRALQ